MLVLSRKLGEKIMIGDSIEVMVVEVNRGTVRLGIVAPREVLIYRAELIKKVEPVDEVPGPDIGGEGG